jgi:F-type H+-transporting ATPase subunit delta
MSEPVDDTFEGTADVSAQRVARTYAEALLNAAEKQGQAEEVLEELQELAQAVRRDPTVAAFFGSGMVPRDRRRAALRATFEGRASDLVTSFLLVLNEHERLEVWRTAITAYRDLYDQRRGVVRVQVRSAAPLPDDQRERLLEELRRNMLLKPVLEVAVDPDLLGGLIVRAGDWLYDASVRSRLATIRDQLSESIKHEIQSGRDRFSPAEGN